MKILQICPAYLSDAVTLPWKNPNVIINSIIQTYF